MRKGIRSRTKRAKRRIQRKRTRKQKQRRMRGGAFKIDSVSKENEANTIVTVRPESHEVDSMPMTGRLTVMRDILERV